jgi:hypothetical protein
MHAGDGFQKCPSVLGAEPTNSAKLDGASDGDEKILLIDLHDVDS